MAKKLEKNVEVMVETPVTEENVTEELVVDEVKVEVDTTPVPEPVEEVVEKNVKIRPNKNHNCNIGGVGYYFEKGKYYTVPMNVKHILNRAGLLMPL